MTVKEFFFAATDLKFDVVISIVDKASSKILYHGPFIDVLKTAYTQRKAHSFNRETMCLKVL